MTLAVTRIWMAGLGTGNKTREGSSSEFGQACLGKSPQSDGNVQRQVSQISFSPLKELFLMLLS